MASFFFFFFLKILSSIIELKLLILECWVSTHCLIQLFLLMNGDLSRTPHMLAT
jgi:hypothetical protein